MLTTAYAALALALVGQVEPQMVAQATIAPVAAAAVAAAQAPVAPPGWNEAVLCENIRLWHRDIVFQMALTVAVGTQANDQPRKTATQALKEAQEAMLDRVQEVYSTSCSTRAPTTDAAPAP